MYHMIDEIASVKIIAFMANVKSLKKKLEMVKVIDYDRLSLLCFKKPENRSTM